MEKLTLEHSGIYIYHLILLSDTLRYIYEFRKLLRVGLDQGNDTKLVTHD
jgi:hypothetical protein